MRPFTIQQGHAEIDRIWKKALKEDGTPITCHRGCSACCSEPLIANIEEAKLALKKVPEGELEGVKARTKDWWERMQASGLDKVMDPTVMPYKAANLTCPLLKNNECMVYANRPIGCRVHCARGPATLCTTDRLKQIYAQSDEITLASSAMLFCDGQRGDHLGVLLHRLLFGSSAQTAAVERVAQISKGVANSKFTVVRYGK